MLSTGPKMCNVYSPQHGGWGECGGNDEFRVSVRIRETTGLSRIVPFLCDAGKILDDAPDIFIFVCF